MRDPDIEVAYLAPDKLCGPPAVKLAVFWRDTLIAPGATFEQVIRHLREYGFRLENPKKWISPTAILHIQDVSH